MKKESVEKAAAAEKRKETESSLEQREYMCRAEGIYLFLHQFFLLTGHIIFLQSSLKDKLFIIVSIGGVFFHLYVGSNKEWIPKPTSSAVQGPATHGTSKVPTTVVGAAVQPHAIFNVPDSREATSKLQKKLEEFHLSQRQYVILPDHIHVPESEKTKLSFGSFGTSFGPVTSNSDCLESDKSPTPVSEASQGTEEAVEEQSLSNQNAVKATKVGDYPGHMPSPTNVPKNFSYAQADVSSSANTEINESKQDSTLPSGGPPYSVDHTSTNYSFGFVPPILGSQLALIENSKSHGHDVSRLPSFVGGVLSTAVPTPLVTQAAGLMESSIAVTQQPVLVFDHLQQCIFPIILQTIFPMVTIFHHSTFHLQPSINFWEMVHFPSNLKLVAATAGVKYSFPPYKPGNNMGNSTRIGIASGYGPYGSATSYNPSSSATAGNSTEDLGAAHFKESNVYIAGQQSDGLAVWVAGPDREISSLPTSSFYNIPPQGQHVTFTLTQAGPGTFAGIYHPAQAAVTEDTVHPLLQQSQTMAGAVDNVGPGGNVYQQPQHAQIDWPSNY